VGELMGARCNDFAMASSLPNSSSGSTRS
jgi:hypothetical protein